MKTSSLPKISDIARRADVSTATVSRALNDKGTVSEGVRRRVIEASEALGYQPQRVHNKTSALRLVAVLADSLISAFFSQILAAMQEQANELGLVAMIVQMPARPEKRAEIIRQLKSKSWAGIISAGFYMSPEEWIDLQQNTHAPLVLLNTSMEHPSMATLKVNFEEASVNAIQHLLDLGHTRIIYLGDLGNEFSAAEFHGVEMALSHHGYSYPDEYRFSISHTPEGASQGIHRIMMLPAESRPTAAFVFDDELAIHVLNMLKYYNLRVPEDISIVGFDNIPMAAYTSPQLTTIDVPKYRIGRQMITLLQHLIENDINEPVGQIIIDGSLVVRGSTGPVYQRGNDP
jgi:LacI family repressor for deo operon, udp, cdd, tsx, nupC, and nupG